MDRELSSAANLRMAGLYDSSTTSYFDLPRSKRTQGNIDAAISPGTSSINPTKFDPTIRRSIGQRANSDYSSVLRRVHVQAIEEDLPDNLPTINSNSTDIPQGSPEKSIGIQGQTDVRDNDGDLLVQGSLQSPQSHTQNTYLPVSKDNQAYPPRLPRLGHRWARTQSGSVWFETPKVLGSKHRGSASSQTNTPTTTSDHITVRTQQTPLKPPPSNRGTSPVSYGTNNIKVETSFNELHRRISDTAETTCSGVQAETAGGSRYSQRSSTKAKKLLSASLQAIRRISLPKSVTPKITISPKPQQSGFSRSESGTEPRLGDHSSLLKRNYTADTLACATAILQEGNRNTTSSV